MKLGSGVVVQQDCWLDIAYNNPHGECIIELGDGANIGRRCTISAANKIIIGKNVLIGPNVLITDTDHEYRNINVPIIQQGITSTTQRIIIGEGTWIGTNAVIIGDLEIGNQCVIAANSLVNQSIPDSCVVAGNPAKIIKIFDCEQRTWIEIKDLEQVNEVLQKRLLIESCQNNI
jgi:acetyltransferase-like isoleucine patch superfamily enzyme